MVRSSTLSFALLIATGLAAQTPDNDRSQRPQGLTLHFPVSSAVLDATDEAALRALCDRKDAGDIAAITLTGHTDVRGTVAYNKILSERRTEAVRNALRSTCLAEKPLSVEWSGESRPLVSGDSESDHAQNRRVDVQLEYIVQTAAISARPISHPKVTPLMPAIDKPRELFRVDGDEEIDLTMSDGVRVRIPAGAIIEADGTPVDGPLDLSYRSFMDPYEIIASGIPMHVNTGANAQHMETAGMYELYASLNGERLALAPGTNITLEQPQGPPLDPAFVGWELDPSTGAWVASGTLSAAPVLSATGNQTTKATAIYWNTLRALRSDPRPDSVRFADRRASGQYCHLAACDTTTPDGSWKRKRDRFDHVARVPDIRVVGYKGTYDPDHVLFTVVIQGQDDMQFPEWRRLPNHAVWEYTGDHPRAVFKRLYGKRHSFQDIDLAMDPGGNDGILRLKENGEWLELPVNAKWDRSKPLRAARWDRAIALYDKQLTKRAVRFDRKVARDVAWYDRDHSNMPLAAWKDARSAMDSSERAMGLDAWCEYAGTRRPMIMERPDQRDLELVQTTFGLAGFGVYNIDRIMKMRDQQNVLAGTIDTDGNAFPWVSGFAVLNNENSVITYWGDGNGTADAFLVSPGRMKSLFLVDAEGRIARAEVAPLNSREPRVVLKVTLVGEPASVDELKTLASR